nr:class I SAM-dependent methyltransferase [bacterium]
MFIANDWQDFAVIDCGGGEKLERWGDYVLRRPDPQAIWARDEGEARWRTPDAHYFRSERGGGQWQFRRTLPQGWPLKWRELTFSVHPTGFKHTGLFPEQAANWAWMMDKIRSAGRPIRVLNAFAYTGGATMACSAEGASVCHVDAAKGMVAWARDNQRLCVLEDRPIRW